MHEKSGRPLGDHFLTARHGAYNFRIFGSVARHEADSASDLDLLVEMVPERILHIT